MSTSLSSCCSGASASASALLPSDMGRFALAPACSSSRHTPSSRFSAARCSGVLWPYCGGRRGAGERRFSALLGRPPTGPAAQARAAH
jgi:hypothetical protein